MADFEGADVAGWGRRGVSFLGSWSLRMRRGGEGTEKGVGITASRHTVRIARHL